MTLPASKECVPRIDAFQWARNGAVPDARFFNLVSAGMNHILAYRRKTVFQIWDRTWVNTGLPGPTAIVQHRFRFHSGYAAQQLRMHYALGRDDIGPNYGSVATFSISVAGSGVSSTFSVNYGQTQAGDGSDAPDVLQWGERGWSISPNTTYEVSVTVEEARVVALLAFEKGTDTPDSTIDYFSDGSSSYGVINDGNRQRFTLGLSSMWKRNGAHLLNWSCNGTAATITGATWTNPTDATTAVASTSAGYILGDSLLTPYGRRVQPLKATLCVYGQVSGGAGTGEVRLYSDSGSGTPTFATVTGIGTTLQWYTLNQTIPSGGDALSAFSKADLQHRMNGAGTLNLYAVSLYLYET